MMKDYMINGPETGFQKVKVILSGCDGKVSGA